MFKLRIMATPFVPLIDPRNQSPNWMLGISVFETISNENFGRK